MKAEVEWILGVIRAGKNFKKHGDPYEFVCTVMRENDRAFLLAAGGTFTKETYKAIEQLLRQMGITVIRWDKKNIKHRRIKKSYADLDH